LKLLRKKAKQCDKHLEERRSLVYLNFHFW
jgi:hypothetical protein